MKEKLLMTCCPKCHGYKGISGKSSGPYVGNPATLPCPRCNAIGEVPLISLTEEEKTPKPKEWFDRDDNP